jgi:citrate/tricarballylate utilization protein
MPHVDLVRHGAHVMTVCNSCRYCEQYCPVFPAVEQRRTFAEVDLAYLANLCHNCGECLYACQYAPPHEFGIDVPATLAQLRVASYEDYCWPRALGGAFRRQGVTTSVALTALLSGVMLASAWLANPAGLWRPNPGGDFYGVVPHAVMVGLFGAVSLFVLSAIAIGVGRFWRDVQRRPIQEASVAALARGVRDALTLRHLHGSGVDCTTSEEARTPWRRWFHHCTFYGFMLCFASTSVAALYHSVLGWHAPYALTSLPVILGTGGGIGMVVGCAGLLASRLQRDTALTVPQQQGLDLAFITMLLLSGLTGLLLLALRDRAVMGPLLVVHLAAVLALFVTLPYGKFVHGFYRLAALVKYGAEREESRRHPVPTPAIQ